MHLLLPALLSLPGGWIAVGVLVVMVVGCAGSDDPIIFGDGSNPGSGLRQDTGPATPGFVQRDTGNAGLLDVVPHVTDPGFSRPPRDLGRDDSPVDIGTDETAAESDPGRRDAGRDTPGGVVLPSCGEEEVQIEKIDAAHVLIVLDRSVSMSSSNWEQAQQAIGEVLTAHGPYIRFGLLMFPMPDDCGVSNQPTVGFALENGDAIVQTMQAEGTAGNTPTARALEVANSVFAQLSTDGARAVILATDGAPNCNNGCGSCTASADGGCFLGLCLFCADEDKCVEKKVKEQVQNLTGAAVPTYVIGITGSSNARDLLNDLATIGGTAKAGDPRYYDTGSAAELATALGDIASTVGSCSVALNVPTGYDFIVVRLNGETVSRDKGHENGWDLLDGDVMQFYGEACDAVADPDAGVTVTYVCKH